MKHYTIHGKNRWCGPGAISAITGISTDEAGWMIREFTWRTRATGTHTHDVATVLFKLGFELNHAQRWRGKAKDRPTLARWLRERTADQRKRMYLVNITGHWMVIHGNKGVDNTTKTWDWISTLPNRRARMVNIYEVTRNPELEVFDVKAAMGAQKAAKRAKSRREGNLRWRLQQAVQELGGKMDLIKHGWDWWELELDAPDGYEWFGEGTSYLYLDGDRDEILRTALDVVGQGTQPAQAD